MDYFPFNNVKLTSAQKGSCEGQITEEELLDAIGVLFVDIIKGPLLARFNHSYINGRLSDTQQEGLISLSIKQIKVVYTVVAKNFENDTNINFHKVC
jgi:hypothetical protein